MNASGWSMTRFEIADYALDRAFNLLLEILGSDNVTCDVDDIPGRDIDISEELFGGVHELGVQKHLVIDSVVDVVLGEAVGVEFGGEEIIADVLPHEVADEPEEDHKSQNEGRQRAEDEEPPATNQCGPSRKLLFR